MTSPTLTLGEQEVQALAYVVLRKCAMADQDYEYALESVKVIYGLVHAHLRGRVPVPMGVDLRVVVVSAATRYNLGLAVARGAKPVGDEQQPPMPTFTGFALSEMVALHRYRVRTVRCLVLAPCTGSGVHRSTGRLSGPSLGGRPCGRSDARRGGLLQGQVGVRQ